MSEKPTLRRSLSIRDLVVYGMLFIGITAPMGTFGVLDARSDGVTPLVFAVAALGMGATAYSYARMSHVVPKAGSVYAYAQAGLGKFPALASGWMLTLDYLFIPAMAVLFMGIAFNALFPAIPTWGFTVCAVVAITVMNLLGVRLAAKVGTWVLVVEIIMLATFVASAIYVLCTSGAVRSVGSPIAGFGRFDWSGMFGAATVAALAFLGFDAIASFAEETTGDTKDVGKALGVCLIVAAALFILQTYLASLLSPYSPEFLRSHPEVQGTAFYDMLDRQRGTWLHLPITLMRAVGPIFSAFVAQAAASRLLYAMGRGGDLPTFLGEVEQKERVPKNATLLSAGVTLVVSTLAALSPSGLETLSTMVTVGALVAFLFLHASVIGYYAFSKGEGVRAAVIPVLGMAVVLVLLIDASHTALLIAAGWAVLGLLARAGRGLFHKKS